MSDRRDGFLWAKECFLDLHSIKGVFAEAYAPSDRHTFTPMGLGAVAFIATHTGVADISDDEALAVVLGLFVFLCRKEVYLSDEFYSALSGETLVFVSGELGLPSHFYNFK